MEKQYEQEEYEKSFMLCGFMLLLCGCSFSGEQEVKERKAGLTQTEPESTKTINTEFDVVPVEYKRGEPQKDDVDILQLTAQALCLEEMLCCRIPGGYLYYGETRRRKKIEFDEEIRDKTNDIFLEMHKYYDRRYTPKAKRTRSCNACSLKDICLPMLGRHESAADYIERNLEVKESV